MRFLSLLPAVLGIAITTASWAGDSLPLTLESKILLGDVKGRIDHFAIDLDRQRLYVTELENNSVGVIDLKDNKTIRTIAGLNEPQGIAYVPWTDTVYVANAGDGSVHLFRGGDLSPSGRIELGEDADNIRIDPRSKRVFIGYGAGALAVIDPSKPAKIAEIGLKAHPESFQFNSAGTEAFVNVPDAREIAVVDLASGRQRAALAIGDARANFPMAVDNDAQRIVVVFRSPPKLMAFGIGNGAVAASSDTCGDADDVFVDSKRHRLYVSCGQGVIDIFSTEGASYKRLARIPTLPGARTSLLVPELDRLFVAVRATSSDPAAVWIFRPLP